MESNTIKEMTLFQIKRKITNIYKNFFFILEDLGDSGYNINDETYQEQVDSDNIHEIHDSQEKFLTSSNKTDYDNAMKNEMPDLWWRTYQKLG